MYFYNRLIPLAYLQYRQKRVENKVELTVQLFLLFMNHGTFSEMDFPP